MSQFTDVQLSMILSALAGDQSLCCDQNAPHREVIAKTPAQLTRLTEWANQNTGCRLGNGLINPDAWRTAARQRYLDKIKHLEGDA